MTGGGGSGSAVRWLTAQTLLFGAMAALLGIVANAMFLDAFGSAWLPVTYVAIGVAGFAVSGAIARTSGRFELLGIATVVLGAAAGLIGAAWVVAASGGGAWVSAPLLVLFPILVQLGFVFVGGQAGRLLDIAGIKASFPRIMAGFSVGAVLGGVLGGQLVAWIGRTEDLLLVTAVVQGAFAALVWATGVRFPERLRVPAARPPTSPATSGAHGEPPTSTSLRRLTASRFVVLIVAYQVLSAVGSQLADFLVLDRATAQYPESAELARYLAGYTAIMNVASIAFLFLAAGPLLRRYGLRLGIAANPAVLMLFAFAMVAVLGATGGASIALLATVSAARIADIALTDGTTRTSINALYQVLPERGRLAVQTTVEGIGVPVAIGISGVLIIVLNALPAALATTIGVTAAVCVVWTWSAVLLYREYGPALAQALHRRRLLAAPSALELTAGDERVARSLLASGDARSARLGLELLAMASPAPADLAMLAADPRPEVRMAALGALAASGDAEARRLLADEVLAMVDDADPRVRARAASYLDALQTADRPRAAALLVDGDAMVRSAALDAVRAGDLFAVAPAIAALDNPRTVGAAAGAVERLGDAVLPALAAALDAAGVPAPGRVVRLVRAAATPSPARDEILRRHVGHPDRELGLVVIGRLAAAGPAPAATDAALAAAQADDVRHAGRLLAALESVGVGGAVADGRDPIRRALSDELDLVGARIRAILLTRHGSGSLGPALVELARGGPSTALAIETLEVALGPADTRAILPLLDPRLTRSERRARMRSSVDAVPPDAAGWLRELVEDADGRWRSSWLRACAIHAARAGGILRDMDIAAARALGDPVVDEELAIADRGPAVAPGG